MKTKNPFPFSDSNKRYHSFDYYLRTKYSKKTAKLPLDMGFTCPNIDGKKGKGGCIFCSDRGSGDFCQDNTLSVREQFEAQVPVYTRKWGEDIKYIPYFQAHTNTYAPTEIIRKMLDDALALGEKYDIAGIAIATRADCISNKTAELLHEYSEKTDLTVELGLQSIHEKTSRRINRCHTYEEFKKGYEKLKGIDVCVHIINGLPGETPEMMLETAKEIARLHPKFLKIHLLHIIEGTALGDEYKAGSYTPLTLEEYVDITVSQLELLPADTVIERVTGDGAPESLLAPMWSKKKFVCMNEIDKEFLRRDSMQGKYCK